MPHKGVKVQDWNAPGLMPDLVNAISEELNISTAAWNSIIDRVHERGWTYSRAAL